MALPERDKLKDIHLASSMEELNELAGFDGNELADLDGNADPTECKTADQNDYDYFKAASYDMEGDEEYAYVYYVRFFNSRKSKYFDNKKYYGDLIEKRKCKKSIERAEALRKSLVERYDKLRAQKEVGRKVPEEAKELKEEEDNATQLDRYEVGEGPRGICLVINNVNFLGEDKRRGGGFDEKDITTLFREDLHFIVQIRRNLDGYEILKTAQEIAKKDHSKYSAFVFIIMSHGEQNDVIYGVDGRKARVEDIMSEFTATNCPTLANKPKLFFIQACRGRAIDPRMGRLSPAADNTEDDSIAVILSPDSNLANGVSPREADFLLAFATVPGYIAWRDKRAGSWFIQVLVDVIRKYHRHHHLLDMLTEVNKQVADKANDKHDDGFSFQVPAPTHTLRKQVFL